MGVVVDELITEEHHFPLEQGGADLGHLLGFQRRGEVDPIYLGSRPSGLRSDG